MPMVKSGNGHRQTLIIQFAKEPMPGKVKTRMLPVLSAEQACDLHCDLLLWTCNTLCEAKLADVELWVSGDGTHSVFERCAGMGITGLRLQEGADLGERMYHAIADGLDRYQQVLLVGSDCPAINAEYLNAALVALDSDPLVLGPATDGGYVLIGATRIEAALFQGVSWGQPSVFAETVERVLALGGSWAELNVLPDIDRPEDIPLWEAIRGHAT